MTVKTAPRANPTGFWNANTAAAACPLRSRSLMTPQPVPGSPSMAAAAGQPSRSNVACGRRSATSAGAPAEPSSRTATFNSWRMKLPLGARPGPREGSDGSFSTSSRRAVMPLSLVRAVTV